MLLGSVSQHCVQQATCPTVVIPKQLPTPITAGFRFSGRMGSRGLATVSPGGGPGSPRAGAGRRVWRLGSRWGIRARSAAERCHGEG
ncbi:hypothetical protein [Actinoplanes sichuanensis]|uniref:Uncharacterized protein n=1 Tax=Actinoplanes sichuanensis TaxID=512349 RepID=A0ABW4A116_9ACTN|nr:hypothetical protein [Actinoplanes sichuanensis]